jgi:hypothetical protein
MPAAAIARLRAIRVGAYGLSETPGLPHLRIELNCKPA